MLLSHHIALWDVVAECNIWLIIASAAVHKLYRTYCEKQTGRPAVKCPSTSPANAMFSLDRLTEVWKKAMEQAISLCFIGTKLCNKKIQPDTVTLSCDGI